MIFNLKLHAPKKTPSVWECLLGWIENKKHNIQIKKLACVGIDHAQETTALKQWKQLWIPLYQEPSKSIKGFPTKSHEAIR
jgi:hypothetical protein